MKKPKNINIKAFWKGTIMSDIDVNPDKFNQLQSSLTKDFFTDDIDLEIDLAVKHLDQVEADFFVQEKNNGYYEAPDKYSQSLYLLIINELVKRGIRPNDDKFGLMIMKSY